MYEIISETRVEGRCIKIVQMNNFYSKWTPTTKYMMEETSKTQSFYNGFWFLIMLLFILPIYNLAQSYRNDNFQHVVSN